MAVVDLKAGLGKEASVVAAVRAGDGSVVAGLVECHRRSCASTATGLRSWERPV